MNEHRIFFTSDLHLGHERAIQFDNRPFKDADEMTEEIIRRWNAKVDKGDTVYVLGDMIWKSSGTEAAELLKRFNGQIILIKGNHDRFAKSSEAKNILAGVKDYADIPVTLEDGTPKRCILSHYFMPFYNARRRGAIHLHGHSHESDEARLEFELAEWLNQNGYENLIFNVGCMYWNYEPVTLDEILLKRNTHLAMN